MKKGLPVAICAGTKTAKIRKSAVIPCSDAEFDEDNYLEKLWECYQQGITQKGLLEKDLFIALIADLIKQIKSKETVSQKSVFSEFTVWQNIKAILSHTFLKWAIQLLPDDSPEQKELAAFSIGYLKRSIARRPLSR